MRKILLLVFALAGVCGCNGSNPRMPPTTPPDLSALPLPGSDGGQNLDLAPGSSDLAPGSPDLGPGWSPDLEPPPQHVSVLTQHNDIGRTGANLAETVLTTANVNVSQFGKLFCRSVDDEIYTQPLVVANVNVPGFGVRDVVYVATMNDSVYAFDASDPAAADPLWSRSFLGPDVVPVQASDMTGACGGNYRDIGGNIGILSTPVIDAAANIMYLVARTKENGGATFVQKLHALDIRDGSELPNSPVTISATVPGTGEGGTLITFDPLRQNQRSSLLLKDGLIYIAWASHCDWGPYHGWLMAYDANTLQQVAVYNSTPDGDAGGIWMSGQGPASDASGAIYLATGNGTVGIKNDPTSVRNRGESFLRLVRSGSSFTVSSWFTPHDYYRLEQGDLDLGSAGLLLIPDTDLAVSAGKSSVMYTVHRTSMGGLSFGRTEDASVQAAKLNAQHLHGSPVYWNGPGGPLIYTWAEYDHLKAFHFDPASSKLDPMPLAMSVNPAPDGMPGGMLSISANGATEGTGILWAYLPESGDANQGVVRGELRAFDAANVAVELWNSSQDEPRDFPGKLAKFTSPTVANGHVYLATFSEAVCVYGLLANVAPLAAPTGLTASASSKSSATLQWTNHSVSETSFAIERKEGAVGFTQIATAPKGATSFVDNTALPFASYAYRVRALGSPAPSAYSNVATVMLAAGTPAPRLQILGAGRQIPMGAQAFSWTTDTDFGAVALGASVSHNLTVNNLGNAALTLSAPVTVGGANPDAFSINTALPTSIPSGGTATLGITFAPTVAGANQATVVITSNDPDQSPFVFAIGGFGVGDLLGWWKLDEMTGQVASDSSGQGNNGTANAVSWVTGHIGGAASFDGTKSEIVVADNASTDPFALTIAAWVNPVDWAGNRRILQKGKYDDQYRLLAEGGVLKFDIGGVGTVTSILPAANVWSHVAATYDGVTMRLFVNGVEVASQPATKAMPATNDPLYIGTKTHGAPPGDHFKGLLDEVRIYGRALTATEIAALAQ